MNYKKYAWPILDVVLLIILLLCAWEAPPSEIVETPPPPNEPTPTWQLVCTLSGGCDGLVDGDSFEERVELCNLDPFNQASDNIRIEFEHYWDEAVDGACVFPCANFVTWDVDDSSDFPCHHLDEDSPVNTFGHPEILYGMWDGTPWSVAFFNGCLCTVNYDWEINIYAYQV